MAKIGKQKSVLQVIEETPLHGKIDIFVMRLASFKTSVGKTLYKFEYSQPVNNYVTATRIA